MYPQNWFSDLPAEGDDFLLNITTGDKRWFCYFDYKRTNRAWNCITSHHALDWKMTKNYMASQGIHILLIPCSERRFSLQFIMTCNMHFTMNIQ